MDAERVIESLLRAVGASPADHDLRLHLARTLIDAERGTEAVGHIAIVLADEPDNTEALAHMRRAMGAGPASAAASDGSMAADDQAFAWDLAEDDLDSTLQPMFVEHVATEAEAAPEPRVGNLIGSTGLSLADVGGMSEVKKRLNAAFLAPMRDEKLRTLYRKSLRGGLLLYGPPGCGKTFIARALAGEMRAQFLSVSLADVLDMWVGSSERNLKELFDTARASAPCLLFLDEVDAIGHKRSRLSSDAMRSTVNQLLLELDGVADANDGVFVLAATNHPWDVDPALRRPGRLDRTMLVLPPDLEARRTIWQGNLIDRPVEGIDVKALAKRSEGLSGADIAHACESAAEIALMHAVESGQVRMIQQSDVEAALSEIRPSSSAWFETARNVVLFANEDGTYDELAVFLRRNRRT